MENKDYDFSGWATKNDLRCSDGRIIRKDAFKHNDGEVVPLVWNHMHNDPFNLIGKARLENRPEGVYAYGYFNDTESGRECKKILNHGDISALSIYANNLTQNGNEVVHGTIKEVSLVLAGANPGACINEIIEHGETLDGSGIIYTGEDIELFHAETEERTEEKVSEEKKAPVEEENDKTLKDVYDTLNEEQKKAVNVIVGLALADANGDGETKDKEGEDNKDMKHNVFDSDERQRNFISHSDMETILADAKRVGSLRDAVEYHRTEGVLMHMDVPTDGMTTATGTQTYGFNDPDFLFPEYRSYSAQPEFITRDLGWVDDFLGGVHRTPFSRIKSVFADLTEDEARAKGYVKGNQKTNQVFALLKRETSPQTIYKKQKLDRDDVIDITDFDVVAWIKGEMRQQLNEEIARAALFGDGRLSGTNDKINETHIRPIATDVALFTIKKNVVTGTPAETAANFIDDCVRARKDYRGTGKPILFVTPELRTEMLLLKTYNGERLYKNETELADAIMVRKIVTVEELANAKDGEGNDLDLLGVIVNPADYSIGADKGGAVSLFDDFDIDYNQMKYLIETRCSGCLTKPFSAIALKKAPSGSTGSTGTTGTTGTTGSTAG